MEQLHQGCDVELFFSLFHGGVPVMLPFAPVVCSSHLTLT